MLQNALPAVLLLLMLVAVAWVLQRYRRHLPGVLRQSGPALKVLSALPLGPQQRVVTVQVGEGDSRVCLVLGVAPGGVTALHSMALPPESAEALAAPAASGFAARLAQFTKGPHAPR